nr:MAG TPA: hypothetical protein [Caudoviricetes sp.]
MKISWKVLCTLEIFTYLRAVDVWKSVPKS